MLKLFLFDEDSSDSYGCYIFMCVSNQSMDLATKSQSTATHTALEYYCWKSSQEKRQRMPVSRKISAFTGMCRSR